MPALLEVILRLETLPVAQRKAALALARERGAEFGIFPLSGAQRRIWFLCALDEQLPLYNVPYAFRLTGPVDADALRLAVEQVVRRHEMLRAVFFEIDGEPFQAVLPAMAVPFVVRDWLAGGPAAVTGLRALLDAEARAPFDLRRGPPVRSGLITDHRQEHVFLLTLHHIVCDGWSLAIILHELGESYAALRENRPPRLPASTARFADVVRRQEADERADRGERLRYWTRQLAGARTELELPTDRARPAVQSHQGDQEIFCWPAELRDSVAGFSAARRLTSFMTVLAALAALLHRYTGAEDVVIGAPVSGRTSLEAESVVGFFVNTVALRLRPSGRMSFSALLDQVREVTLAAQAHEMPFEVLVESLRPARSFSRHPLVQACFVVLETENELLRLPGVTCEPVFGHSGTSKFDLTMSLIAVPAGLRGVVEYDDQIFRRDTVRRIVAELRSLLTAALAAPERDIGSLPVATGSVATGNGG